MAKVSNEKKLEALKRFLDENKMSYIENYNSKFFGVKIPLLVDKVRIAVFLSTDDKDYEDRIVHLRAENARKTPFYAIYNPFFIRSSETKAFILEKMQNCIIKRMMYFQSKFERENKKLNKESK